MNLTPYRICFSYPFCEPEGFLRNSLETKAVNDQMSEVLHRVEGIEGSDMAVLSITWRRTEGTWEVRDGEGIPVR
ncbi:hypothetical protein L6452_18986 [Arctium lappa]|uniref:Uncharacterized protein n=1 Tax=Arctium lappa TaxID=4217 RepID=A0ACB9B877_ARCLA|nr:hypothetical protein L6452_18986 [Arctium lappa]